MSTKFMIYVFGMTLVGIIFAFVLISLSNPWTSIGKVPGTPTELFDNWPNIYVRTSDNLLYACDKRQKSCSPTNPDVSPPDLSPQRHCGKPEINLSQAPGKVVAAFTCAACGSDSYVEIQVAALDDGSIWTRNITDSAIDRKYESVTLFLGGLIGFIVGLYMFWRSRRQEAQEKSKR